MGSAVEKARDEAGDPTATGTVDDPTDPRDPTDPTDPHHRRIHDPAYDHHATPDDQVEFVRRT